MQISDPSTTTFVAIMATTVRVNSPDTEERNNLTSRWPGRSTAPVFPGYTWMSLSM